MNLGVPAIYLDASGITSTVLSQVDGLVRFDHNKIREDVEKFCITPSGSQGLKFIDNCLQTLMQGNKMKPSLRAIIRGKNV